MKQESDSEGAGVSGLRQHNLNDPDSDFYFNLNGSIAELDSLICEKVIPPFRWVPPWWEEDLDLIIINVIDVPNHRCCLLPPDYPPTIIELHLELLGLVTTGNNFHVNGPASFMPLIGDAPGPDGSFHLQSVSNIAGFPGIVTHMNGQFTPFGLTGEIIIGAAGGLPSGLPIIFEFEVFPPGPPGSVWPWLLEPLPPLPEPFIRVNGERHSLILPPFDPFSIQIGLESGGQDTLVDFFLVAQFDQQFFHFDLASGTFLPGLIPTAQGPLQDIFNLPIYTDLLGLPPFPLGPILHFGFDTQPNFLLDPPSYHGDSLELHVQAILPP
jgi:hypothetical protein